MLASVLLYSFVPLLLLLVGGDEYPFLFNGVYRLGGAVCGWGYLFWRFRFLLVEAESSRVLAKRVFAWSYLPCLLPFYGFTALALSAGYVDLALTAILKGLWPLFFIVFVGRALRAAGGGRRFLDAGLVGLALVGFLGFVLVSVGQEGLSVGAGGGLAFLGEGPFVLGVLLGLLAALFDASTAYNYRWAWRLKCYFPAGSVGRLRPGEAELFGMLLAFAIGSSVSFLVNTGLGFVLEGAAVSQLAGLHWALLLAVLGVIWAGGFLFDGPGTVFNRRANLMARDLGVNAWNYLMPAFTLVWLFLFVSVGLARVDWFLFGVALILLTNYLAAFPPAVRLVLGAGDLPPPLGRGFPGLGPALLSAGLLGVALYFSGRQSVVLLAWLSGLVF